VAEGWHELGEGDPMGCDCLSSRLGAAGFRMRRSWKKLIEEVDGAWWGSQAGGTIFNQNT